MIQSNISKTINFLSFNFYNNRKNNYLLKIGFQFATSNQIKAKLQRKFKKEKIKTSKELTILKKVLAQKQPVKNLSIYDEIHHKEIYQKIDTDLEAFFFKRQYNLQNFNFLLNLLGEQKKFKYIQEVMKKMKMLNIQPDQRTYNYLIKAASLQGDIKKTQQMFQMACKMFMPNKYFYTTLMQSYIKHKNSEMAFGILKQMKEKGIQPDLAAYTTVINSFRVDRDLPKCWQVHRQLVRSNVPLDQTYVGVMMKVYSATHDAEKCIKLYREQISQKNIVPMLQTKNSYLKALSSRVQYSQKAIDMFFDMYQKGQVFNEQTVRWALKACSVSANLRSAVQIVKILKIRGIAPTKQIYNSLLRVYGKVCDLSHVNQDFRQVILIDTFKLLQQIQARDMVDTTILNNVLNIYSISDQSQKIDGLILPLYEKFNLPFNSYTFQILMKMYYNKQDFNTAIRLWNQCKLDIIEKQKQYSQEHSYQLINHEQRKNYLTKREEYRETFNMMDMYLNIGIKMMDMNMVLQVLNMFKKLDRLPKNQTLKFLGNLKNLPQQILVSLMDFKVRFGAAKLQKKNQGHIQDPQNIK